jgi:hypothetical protein
MAKLARTLLGKSPIVTIVGDTEVGEQAPVQVQYVNEYPVLGIAATTYCVP